jgi:hypothetical protein
MYLRECRGGIMSLKEDLGKYMDRMMSTVRGKKSNK